MTTRTQPNPSGQTKRKSSLLASNPVMRRLDTLVIEFPEIYRCIKASDIDKTYEMPKSYVNYRRPRKLTKEQRKNAVERARKLRQK